MYDRTTLLAKSVIADRHAEAVSRRRAAAADDGTGLPRRTTSRPFPASAIRHAWLSLAHAAAAGLLHRPLRRGHPS